MDTASTQAQDLPTALQRCAVSATPWFAVIDAAQDDTVPGKARDAGLLAQSLYAGERGAELEHVAPHLTTFDLNGEFSTWLFDHWDGNHGILLQSSASFETLRKHLKRFLVVKNEDGKTYRLRYFDPRVLRAFIPACTGAELKNFFGPVDSYYAAGRGGESVWSYAWGRNGLSDQEHPIRKKEVPSASAAARDGGRATGSLTVTLVDTADGAPLGGASVQVTGPMTREAVTGEWGDIRFERLIAGSYQVYAIDQEMRMGESTVAVTESGTQIKLFCQASS